MTNRGRVADGYCSARFVLAINEILSNAIGRLSPILHEAPRAGEPERYVKYHFKSNMYAKGNALQLHIACIID